MTYFCLLLQSNVFYGSKKIPKDDKCRMWKVCQRWALRACVLKQAPNPPQNGSAVITRLTAMFNVFIEGFSPMSFPSCMRKRMVAQVSEAAMFTPAKLTRRNAWPFLEAWARTTCGGLFYPTTRQREGMLNITWACGPHRESFQQNAFSNEGVLLTSFRAVIPNTRLLSQDRKHLVCA